MAGNVVCNFVHKLKQQINIVLNFHFAGYNIMITLCKLFLALGSDCNFVQ